MLSMFLSVYVSLSAKSNNYDNSHARDDWVVLLFYVLNSVILNRDKVYSCEQLKGNEIL